MRVLHAFGGDDAALVAGPGSRCTRLELGLVDAVRRDTKLLEVTGQRLELAKRTRRAARGGQRLARAPLVDDNAPTAGRADHFGAYAGAGVDQTS